MEVNKKSDVYSFGVLTLEILLGKHPGDIVIMKEVVLIIRSAVACLTESPRSRPTMEEICKEFVTLK
jgi:serine/threonine protein kinase